MFTDEYRKCFVLADNQLAFMKQSLEKLNRVQSENELKRKI